LAAIERATGGQAEREVSRVRRAEGGDGAAVGLEQRVNGGVGLGGLREQVLPVDEEQRHLFPRLMQRMATQQIEALALWANSY
jgi:hypothetical protein